MASTSGKAASSGGLIAVLLIAAVILSPQPAAFAVEHLANGGFEQGADGWSPSLGFSTSGCAPHGGGQAGALTTSASEQSAFVQQSIEQAFAQGSYSLQGYALLASGTPNVKADLFWYVDGSLVASAQVTLQPSASWSQFELESTSPASPTRLVVKLTSTAAGNSLLCFDDLSIDGPPLATPTPEPTSTSTSTPSPTPTATAQPTATLTPTGVATATSIATAASTATGAVTVTPVTSPTLPPTATGTATVTPAAATTSGFANGGFEDGTAGWRKFGGEFYAVTAPRRDGGGAAAFTSTTESTK